MIRFLLIMLIVPVLMGLASKEEIYAQQLHQRNKKLIKQGLIPPMKYFKEVPRITPSEAYALYVANKAIFIAIGLDTPRLIDGWLLENYMQFNPKRLKIPKNMFVVFY